MMRKLFYLPLLFMLACATGDESGDFASEGNATSQGGSLARFTIVDDYLYIVNDFSLVPINIEDLQNPLREDSVFLGFGIETIFQSGNTLFIGSNSAVYIYSIANPANPQWLSTYQHATGCDPVVVNGEYAYVTLRDGISCNNPFEINVLEVVNVENLRNPFQVHTHRMFSPAGLGVGCNNKLFVCEGVNGLVQFDLSDPAFPVVEVEYRDLPANDVIIKDDLLIVTGDEGVYQYNCDADTIELISKLPISL